jgi:hypothetical protein
MKRFSAFKSISLYPMLILLFLYGAEEIDKSLIARTMPRQLLGRPSLLSYGGLVLHVQYIRGAWEILNNYTT